MDWNIPDSHLSLPICVEECLDVLRIEDERTCRIHRPIKDHIMQQKVTKIIYDACNSPWDCLTKWVITTPIAQCKHEKRIFFESIHATQLAYHHLKLRWPEVEALRIDPLAHLHLWKLKADTIKDLIRDTWKGQPFQLDRIIWSDSISIFLCPIHKASVCPTTLISAVLDSLQRRFSAAFYYALGDSINKYPIKMLPRFLDADRALIALRSSTGERFFRILKDLHAYVTGWVISNPDDVGFTQLLRSVETEWDIVIPEWKNYDLTALFTSPEFTTANIFMNLEFAGVAKAYGHPMVKVSEGMDTLRKYACTQTRRSMDISLAVRNHYIYQFCQQWFAKHHSWPDVTSRGVLHPFIEHAILDNSWPPPHKMRQIDLDEWGQLEFNKIFEFNMHPDTIDLLSDKACSPGRENWMQNYDVCGFRLHWNIERPRFPSPRYETRVLLRYLTANRQATEQIVTEVNNQIFNPSHDIITVCAKEGEESSSGRLFAKLTWERRLWQTATESALADGPLRYMPHQSMTMKETDLLKRIALMNIELQTPGGVRKIGGSFDIKKFNLNFTHDITQPLFKVLDDQFGMKWCFQDTHAHFMRSLITTNIRTRPPRPTTGRDPLPGPYAHYLQGGGQEGLRQKGWTLIIQQAILVYAHNNNYRLTLLGQGDNQTFILTLTGHQRQDPSRAAREFVEGIQVWLTDLGLPLKMEETWYSRFLFQYNKESYYKGAHCYNGLKYAIKMGPDSNDVIPTLSTRIASISTIGEAISRRDRSPFCGYAMMCLEIMHLYHRVGLFNLPSASSYMPYCFWNSCLGGYPVSFLINLVLRGFSDRLTYQLSILKFLLNHYPDVGTKLAKVCPGYTAPERRWNLLLMDAFALNLASPSGIEPFVRELVRESLEKVASNPDVTSVLERARCENPNLLVSSLVSMRPYHARVAAELFRCSNIGQLISMCALFDKSRTFVTLAKSSSTKNFYDEIHRREKLIIRHQRFNYKSGYTSTPVLIVLQNSDCPTECSRILRKQSWGIEIHGVTMATPQDQGDLYSWDDLNAELISRSILFTTSQAARQNPSSVLYSLGPFPPYFGSATNEKTTKNPLTGDEVTSIDKVVRRLGTIMSWGIKSNSPQLYQIAVDLIKAKGREVPEEGPSIRGGNIFHRFNSASDKQSCLSNVLTSMFSHVNISTSQMEYYASGAEDYTIFFQSLFIYGCYRCLDQNPMEASYGYTISCPKCTICVPEDPLTFQIRIGDSQFLVPPYIDCREDPSLISSLILARKISRSAKSFDLDLYFSSTTQGVHSGYLSLGIVTVPEIRVANLHALISGILVRSYSIIMKWTNESDICGLEGFLPASFSALTAAIFKSGRLPELCNILKLPLSYYGSINPAQAAREIIPGFRKYVRFHSATLALYGKYCFSDERPSLIKRSLTALEKLSIFAIPDVYVLPLGQEEIEAWDSKNIKIPPFIPPSHFPRAVKRSLWHGVSLSKRGRCLVQPGRSFPPLYQLSRGCGIVTSAASKYLEILTRGRNHIPEYDVICCLADGCGGLLGTLLHLTESKGYFNTRIEDDVNRLSEPAMYIPAGLLKCGYHSRVLGLPLAVTGETDLCYGRTWQKLASQLSGSNAQYVLITIDADGQDLAFVELVLGNLLPLLSTLNKWELIYKSYGPLVLRISEIFRENHIGGEWIKPLSSNPESKEVFFVSQSGSKDEMNESSVLESLDEINIGGSFVYMDDMIHVGQMLRALHPCTDISLQNLVQLTRLELHEISHAACYKRMISTAKADWESLDSDPLLEESVRRYGRDYAAVRSCLIYGTFSWIMRRGLHELPWILSIFSNHALKFGRFRNQWPSTTNRGFLMEITNQDSIIETHYELVKIIVRACLALPISKCKDEMTYPWSPLERRRI